MSTQIASDQFRGLRRLQASLIGIGNELFQGKKANAAMAISFSEWLQQRSTGDLGVSSVAAVNKVKQGQGIPMVATTTSLAPSEASPEPAVRTVYVVEDDLAAREAISELLSPSGMDVRTFRSAEEFLNGYSPTGVACLLLDERLPGMPGSELLRRLYEDGIELPTVVVTAFATTPYTVTAMRHGATSVLDKPCSDMMIREAVSDALSVDERRRRRQEGYRSAKQKLASLSESEREVLGMVVRGTPNKQIARRLNVCVRTIEARRSRIYQSAGVNTVAELVRLCVAAGFIDAED